jgi:hypothetical protein
MARMSSSIVVVLGVSVLAACVAPRSNRDTMSVAELSSRSEEKARAAAKRALRDVQDAVAAGAGASWSNNAAVAAVKRAARSEEKAVTAAARVPRSDGGVVAAAESAVLGRWLVLMGLRVGKRPASAVSAGSPASVLGLGPGRSLCHE